MSQEEENVTESSVMDSDAQTSNQPVKKEQQLTEEVEEEWISIFMDGRLFTTTRAIIESDRESALCLMFQKDSPFLLARDLSHPMNPYLLDRNPKYFEPILNYLRTGGDQLVIDNDINPRGVLLEAQYFNLQTLVQKLEFYVQKWEIKHGVPLTDSDPELEPELTRADIVRALIQSPTSSCLRFRGLKLMGLDLSGLDLSGANLQHCNLSNAKLMNTNLEEADLSDADLSGAVFSHSKMSRCNLSRCRAQKAVFKGCELVNGKMVNCDFSHCDFRDSNLTNADMMHTMLINSNLAGARITGVKLKGTILTGMRHTHSMGGVINMK